MGPEAEVALAVGVRLFLDERQTRPVLLAAGDAEPRGRAGDALALGRAEGAE